MLESSMGLEAALAADAWMSGILWAGRQGGCVLPELVEARGKGKDRL